MYKDASANKGGVTSSSLEVLASLSFDDQGFIENMCIKEDGTAPPFYDAYVKEVQATIKRNAALEFEAIWREHQQTGIARSTLSDTLSNAITKLDEELQKTDLWKNVALRDNVLEDALPGLLLEKIGLKTIIERVSIHNPRSSSDTSDDGFRCRTNTFGRFLEATWPAALCTSTVATQANSPSLTCELILLFKQQSTDCKQHVEANGTSASAARDIAAQL